MKTHSPIPWRVAPDPQGRADILDASGEQVAMMSDNGFDVANAELLVAAVNADDDPYLNGTEEENHRRYKAMENALRRFVAAFNEASMEEADGQGWSNILNGALMDANAALAAGR